MRELLGSDRYVPGKEPNMIPGVSKSTDWSLQVLDNAPAAIMALRAKRNVNGEITDFEFVFANKKALESVRQATLEGKLITQEFPESKKSGLFNIYNRVTETGEPWSGEIKYDEGSLNFCAYVSAVKMDDGCLVSYIDITDNVFNNIAERKRSEKRHAYLLKLSDTLRSLFDPEDIVDAVANEAISYFNADRCYYCEIEGDKAVIRRDAFRGNLPSVSGTYPLNEFAVFKSVIEAGQPFVVPDVHTTELVDESLRELCISLNVVSFIDVPVIKQGKARGIFCMVQSEPREWTIGEVELAVETAERTWAAVERAKAEMQLKELNESLEKLVEERANYIRRITETVPDMISVIELETKKVEFVNQATFRVRDYDPDTMLSRDHKQLRDQLIHQDDHAVLENYYRRFESMSDEDITEAEYRAKGFNSYHWSWYRVRGRVFLRNAEGRPTHNLNVIQEITQEKQSAEKIWELNLMLTQKNRELAYVNSELKTFNTIAANDYNEALKHIYLHLEQIINTDAKKLSDSGRANLRRAQSAVQKLKLLTEDLNAYTQLKGPDVQLQQVDLGSVIDGALMDLNKQKDLFDCEMNCHEFPVVTGYPFLLSLVFHHLFDNAIKFRKEAKAHIKLDCYRSVNKYHIISVIDEGIGFPAEEAQRIFNIFYRTHEKNKYRGSGIGLAICKKIMELHGGFIVAEGEPGKGATFNCYFPA